MAASTDSTLLDNLSKKPDVLQEEFGSDGEVSKVRRKGPVDSFRHRKLLDAIGSLGGKKKVTPRTEPSLTVSEYDLSKASVEKVAVHQLLMNLKKTEAHRQIKKKVRSIVRNAKVLAEPLHGPQQQRARRQVAYEKVGEEVSVWEPVVRQNRVAEQLRFPLNQPSLKMESAGKFTERFKPRTELEREINKILKVSENVTPPGAELTPAEEKALKAMSLEEAKERLAELKKMRALLSYQEMKARRQGKIKSKKYHRILKKERLKKQMKEFEELKEKDPELAIEKLKELEKQRILERVSLRHRGTGKWAKQQMLRTKYNQESREALLKQLELSRQLTQKPLVESSDDEGAMDSAAAQEVAAAHTGELEARFFSSANPWLKNPAGSRPHTSADNADEDNDAATLDTVPENIGSVQSAEAVVAVSGKEADDKSGNVQPVEPVNSMESQEECLITVEAMTEASSNMQPVELVTSAKSEEECLNTAEAVAEASSCATDEKGKNAGLTKPKRDDQVKVGSVKKGAKRKLALVKKNRGVGSAQASKAVKASQEEDVNIDRMFDSLDDHDMKKRKEAMTESSINVQPAEPVNNTKSAEECLITAEAVAEASSCATNGKKEKNAGLTKPKRDDQVKLGSVKKGAKRKLALVKKNRGVGSAQASKAVKASREEDVNIDRMFDSLDDHDMKKRKEAMTEASINVQPAEPVNNTKSAEEGLITAEAVTEASSCATNGKKEKNAGLTKPKRDDQVKLGSVKKGAKRKLALIKKNRGVGSAQASKAVKASREEDVNIDRMFDSLDDHDMKKRKEAMTEASINVQPAEPVNNTKSAEEGLITAEAVTEASSCATNGKKEKNAGLTKPKRDDQVKLSSVKKGAKRKLALIKKNRGVGSAQASKAVKASLEEDFNIDRMFDSLDDHNMKKRKKIKPGQKGKNQKVKKFAARKEQKETSKKENKNSDGRTTMEGLESTEYEAQLDETLERKQTLKDMESFSQDNAAESAQKPRCSLVPQPVESEANPDKVEVDPTKFLEVKQQILKSRAPDLGGTAEDALDDEDMEKEQAVTIAEAFADDDVISAFREEKKAQVKQDTPQGVDLFLPGWGSWGGSGIKVDRKKRRRFFVKPPPAPPRKDQTLGNVIISEAKDEKLEAHQVSALPFPFNNVSQFESVISHPVGSLWNPETSFRELTAPKVVAKIGQVIDPMDRDALIVKKKENVVDKLLEQKKAETKHNQQPRRWRKKK